MGENLKENMLLTLLARYGWGHIDEAELPSDCWSSLSLVNSKGLNSILFPSIGTRGYSYPIELASKV